tara:strand:- start:2172 stop:2384 length:213 start_codon:yes stop_codon:yes gene_type:complete
MPRHTDPALFAQESSITPPEKEEVPMITRRYWPAALLLLVVSLSACSGNHKFNDGEYRPLGDPQSVKRGE